MNDLKYQLGARVKITASGEEGEIIGRAEYSTATPAYLIRYAAGDGRAVEAWWSEDALNLAV